jgi:endoglucanase
MNMNRYGCAWVGVAFLSGVVGCIPDGAPVVAGNAAASPADGKACPPDGMIDDAEDDNNQVAPNKGRSGYWYTFLDKAGSTVTPATGGTFTMSAGGASGSAHAAHASGKIGGGAVVFGGMGFNFIDPKGSYDASAYKGFSFWAKATAPVKVRVKVPDADTDPDGKVCTECFNDFGTDIELTTTWTKYTLPFNSLTQLQGWGAPHPPGVNPARLFGIQWQVNTPGASYDVWVDDIAFTGCP